MPWLPLAVAGYFYFYVPARTLPAGKTSKIRSESGTGRLRNEKFRLIDDTRPTTPHNGRPGRPYRELRGEIWRPARQVKPAPLLVYSHGFMSNRRESVYLVRFLASHGYTVAAVDFPLTGTRASGKPLAGDIVNQPGDVSALIDVMLERNNNPRDRLFNTIDPEKIAVAGLSYGALTSLLATYHGEWLDSRISATVSIAGPTSMFSPAFFAGRNTPTLMIYGDADSLVRYDQHATPATRVMNDAGLVTLKNGSHAGFAQSASTSLRFLRNPDLLACSMLRWQIDNKPWDFVTDLGGSKMGIVQPDEEIAPLTTPLVPVAMKASRQQMFTSLATHAFLESRFADNLSARRKAHQYLYRTLPKENGSEVSVNEPVLMP